MTLDTTTSRVSYIGAGSAGPFAYPFRILQDVDLLVTKRSAAGAETILALGAGYTVTGALSASGTVTLSTALAVGETLFIRRSPALTQTTSIRNQGEYFAATHEDTFDRLTMQLQSVKDSLDRCVKLKETVSGAPSLVELEPTAGKVVTGTGTGFTMSTLDSSATALPGASRTVATLSAYLANNSVFNVKDYGAIGNGAAVEDAAFQLTATSCTDGGTVVVPDGSFVLASSVKNTVGKNVTWILFGKILDRAPAWADITNDATLNGKGMIAFSGGRVAVLGTEKIHYDGGVSVGGVSQNQRHMFYFYNCDSVTVKDLITVNGIGRAVGTYGCRNITHKDCTHSGGYAPVVHRSPSNCTVDNVSVINATNSGVSIGNRGFLDVGVLPWTRGSNCKIINSFAYNIQNGDVSVGTGTVSCVAGAATFSTSQAGIIANGMGIIVANVQYIVSAFNGTTLCTLSAAPTFGASSFAYSTGTVAFSAGVGLTIDSVDGWTLANNIVDGLNLGTFAYSLADSNDGTATGNVAKNYNNVHIGAQLPGGLGMECVRIANSSFKATVFLNVICGYQISDSIDCDFDGVYTNVPASLANMSDAANSSFATIATSVTPSDNIKISGVQYGGTSGVVTSGPIKKLVIAGLHTRETFQRFLSGLGGGVIDTLIITDSSWYRTGSSTVGCLSQPSGVVKDVDVKRFSAIAGGITAGQSFCDFGSGSSRSRFSDIVLKNFDIGWNPPAVVMTELRLRHVDFTNVNTQWAGISNIVNFSARDISVAGVSQMSYGRQGLEGDFLNLITYAAAMTPNAQLGKLWEIRPTDGNPFTINAPTNPPAGGGAGGGRINLRIKNVSGGGLGAVTFNAVFKQAGFAVGSATNGNSTSADFAYDTANGLWIQITPWTVNVPN